MCTLIVLHRCVPGRPLVVAANRDEFFARPAEGPAIRATRRGRVVAPRDLEAGGTWVGLSDQGVFAGLTNLRPVASESGSAALGGEADGAAQAPLRSRGEVVMAALEARTAEEAATALAALAPGLHNPFQLLVADARAAWLIVYRDAPQLIALDPGLHVVGNVVEDGSIDSEAPRTQKLMRIRSRVEKLLTEPGLDLFEGLARICREHVEDEASGEPGEEPARRSAFESTCVHVADRYGTRSSLLLELSNEVPASRLWTTDGPPCRRPFENRSSLLRELGIQLAA